MNSIISLIGNVLGWLMYFSYHLLHNYFLSILFFTFLTKIVLFPVSRMVQRNSIKMVKMQPEMNFMRKYQRSSMNFIRESIISHWLI